MTSKHSRKTVNDRHFVLSSIKANKADFEVFYECLESVPETKLNRAFDLLFEEVAQHQTTRHNEHEKHA